MAIPHSIAHCCATSALITRIISGGVFVLITLMHRKLDGVWFSGIPSCIYGFAIWYTGGMMNSRVMTGGKKETIMMDGMDDGIKTF